MELKSDKNFGIRKMGIIDMIKTSLEQHCPQTVSCADIIQLAAREAIYLVYIFILIHVRLLKLCYPIKKKNENSTNTGLIKPIRNKEQTEMLTKT